MSPSRPHSLRLWLGALVTAVALPVLALLFVICVAQVRREQAEARQRALGLAKATAIRVREMHSESVELLARMSALPGVLAFDPASCRAAFSVVDFLPRYADVFLYDDAGRLVCSGNTQPENERVSVLARHWIERELHGGRLLPGTPVMHAFGDKSMMMLTAPVARTGRIVLLEFVDVLGRGALIANAVLTILDRNGSVVARSEAAEAWSGINVRETRIAALGSSTTEGIAEAKGVDGVSREYGFIHLPELDWVVYAGVPTAAIVQPVREMLVNGTVGTIGIALIVTVVTLSVARRIIRPIHALVAASTTAQEGAYGRVETVAGPLEIATLTRAFNRMVDRRQETDEQMRDHEQRLKALSERLLTAQEEERSRIARELHDDLGQSLTALKMDVIGLMNAVPQPPELAPIRDRILSTLDATVASVQQISSELRPSVLDDLGLVAAIEAEARLFEERSGIECEVSASGDVPVDRDCVTAIYRIVQESLTNVARHSNATRTEVRMRHRAEELLLEIRDDGRGVTGDEISDPMSLGLVGIRERADLVGGSVHFEGVAGRGTIVSVRIPMPQRTGPA